MAKESLNGSVELLAKAMRTVFSEAVEEGVRAVKDAVDVEEKGRPDEEGSLTISPAS